MADEQVDPADTGPGLESKSRSAFQDYKVRFDIDAKGLKSLNTQFKNLNAHLETFKTRIDDALAAANAFGGAVSGMTGALSGANRQIPEVSSGSSTKAGGVKTPKDRTSKGITTNSVADGKFDGVGPMGKMKSMLGTPGEGGGMNPVLKVLAQGLTGVMSASAANIKGRADYTLEADRTGLLMRQMHGGTQLQYQAKWRQPMTDRMLGPGGIASMMTLQTTMGINPESMAAGVEGIRVASGFGYSTGDATKMITAMAQPGSANLMTMMMGTSMYAPGGKARDPMDVVRDVVQRMGLTSESMVEGAFQPGSMTRANLSRTGLPQDMQNLVLQYAQENIEFQKKGGKGMYDPSDERDRNRMGIEGSYAMEREKTSMAEVNRAEDFYRRQVDNYADLERNTQKLIKVFGALEDKLSGLVGAQTSLTNNPLLRAAGGAMRGAGSIMQALGAVGLMMPEPTGGSKIIGAGLLAGGTLLGAIGDVPEITEPGMDAGFKSKLRAMATQAEAEGVPLSLTSGIRDTQVQRRLFLERHDEDPNGNRSFEGKTYSLNAVGEAKGYAAPPGSSLHEVGLAADLGPEGSHGWIVENAHKFGLRHGDSFGEPWHVAPAGMTRAKYNAANPRASASATGRTLGSRTGASKSSGVSSGNVHMTKGMGIAESIKTIETSNAARVSAGIGDAGGGGAVITIAPVIHLNGSGNDAADAQRLAQRVIHMIETAEAVRSLRRA